MQDQVGVLLQLELYAQSTYHATHAEVWVRGCASSLLNAFAKRVQHSTPLTDMVHPPEVMPTNRFDIQPLSYWDAALSLQNPWKSKSAQVQLWAHREHQLVPVLGPTCFVS